MAEEECPKCPDCLPAWLAQFGDLMSLLLVFFVLLLSMSVMDDKKIIEYMAHMKQSLGVMENSSLTTVTRLQDISKTVEMEKTSENMEQTMNEITETILELNKRAMFNKEEVNEIMDDEDFAQLEIGKEGFILKLPTSILFKEGEYKISDKSSLSFFFNSLRETLNTMPKDLEIEIGGFTNEQEASFLNEYQAPYNLWQLGFFRAEEILNLFKNTLTTDELDSFNFVLKSYGNTNLESFKQLDKNTRVEIYLKSKKYQSKLSKDENSLFDNIGNINNENK